MQTWQRPNDGARERDRRLGGLRRLTMWAATGGVVGVGLFGAIGALTIPGAATTTSTQPASTTTSTGSSSSSSSAGNSSGTTTVQAPTSAPTSASSSSGGTTHAVSGGS